jgi:4-hydroxyphenylacetate 3-monooxygenase
VPWEDVFFYQHIEAATFIRATLHRYSIFPFVQRHLRYADLLLGFAHASARQTGTKMHQAVREKIAQVAAYREGINAFLTAAIELAEPSPGGLLMPHPATMYSGRVFACSNLPEIMHTVRDLAGCQISLIPSAAQFMNSDTGPWLSKYFAVGDVDAEERRKLLAYGRDLLNSDYATHRLTFQLFAQSPPFSHLLAVYNNYDFEPATELLRASAGLKTIDGK